LRLITSRSRRLKISKDPRNTKWSRDTARFGQRILRSQGWEPGQYLGPQDASHAILHTEANANHIRVTFKDDSLGLGAKLARGDECTGLDVFKDLLGRLNGKSESTIEKEQAVRATVQRHRYMERKYGTILFVRGATLGGTLPTELDASSRGQEDLLEANDSACDESKIKGKSEKRVKKRKANDLGLLKTTSSHKSSDRKRRNKKEVEDEEGASMSEEKEKQKSAKKRRRKDPDLSEEKFTAEEDFSRHVRSKQDTALDDGSGSPKNSEENAKATKKAAKAERKAAKRILRGNNGEDASTEGNSTPASEPENPTVSMRHLSRQRFIAQKRRAVLDPQALKQVCSAQGIAARLKLMRCADLHD
jgi:Pin2-interacting protein X1